MKIIHIELVNSHGETVDSTILNVEDNEPDLEGKVAVALTAFCGEVVSTMATGDTIRISEYNELH